MRRLRLLFRIAFRNVFRNRYRSIYALATIGMGALGLFIFMGFNRGLMNQYRANAIRARWAHGLLCTPGYRDTAWEKPSEHWIADPDSLLPKLRAIPGVRDVFPRITVNALMGSGDATLVAQGEAIDGVSEARFFTQLNFVSGGDFRDSPNGVVLGQGLAQGLGAKVGDELDLSLRNVHNEEKDTKVKVTGIFHTGSSEFDRYAFRMPLQLAQTLMDTRSVESIYVALNDDAGWPAFAEAVHRVTTLQTIPFDELDKVYYKHAVDWLDAQFGFIRGIILLIVFLAVFNVISMTVMERTVEIATLRANGESRAEVVAMHAAEAVLLGVIGACVGIVAGYLLVLGPLAKGIAMPPAPGITRSFRILIELAARDVGQVAILCTITALLGCVVPLWRALRVPIATALRHA